MNILVTGAAGFIGSFLCEALCEAEHRVLGIDNYFRGKKDNLTQLANNPLFEQETIDLSDARHLSSLHQMIKQYQIECICHLAAINGTQYFYDQPYFVLDQNIRITQNLLMALEHTKVNYLLYTSSSEIYGEALKIPTPETEPSLTRITANRDVYAISKSVDEFYIHHFCERNKMKSLILRVFNIYGPRMVGTRYGQVIPEFVHRLLYSDQFTILGDGHHTRSFCFIKDLITMISQLLSQQLTGIFNVGNDAEISILELAQLIHKIAHKKFDPVFLDPRPDDHARRCPDLTRLKTIVDPIEFTPLAVGIKEVFYFLRHNKTIPHLGHSL